MAQLKTNENQPMANRYLKEPKPPKKPTPERISSSPALPVLTGQTRRFKHYLTRHVRPVTGQAGPGSDQYNEGLQYGLT
ncbi:hypothetical protein PCANC_16428 [Puccinia coronata f. sp. avenae]|uniref:Uncharacterized protein n=1 Tax=Puccinia coronata f. sp. avenae TaxID=200324 RepID=A0A2N5SHY9_9BASI|nr:hypothetical protein PCANC_19198 [Puccinia coronata f. sp. avenae]PLW34186.1 hypothetical protein PCASD_13306 [Puccinia coronata f. sp. avenae]PLW35310.1 hypothetical protein PCANC_16428 [Puccinia coronata f. sp. avenae]